MEVLLALIALICVWIVYGHVSRLRSDVYTLQDKVETLRTQLNALSKEPPRAEPPKPAAAPAEAVRAAPVTPQPPPPKPVEPRPAPPPPPAPAPVAPKPAPAPPKPEPVAARQASPPPPKPPAPPKPRIAWEQQIGARLPVWIGAIALIASGIFLVQYSIEHGYLSPLVRCILAGVMGAALIVAAQIVSLRKIANHERIAQALSGAGVAVIYGALFAASTVYGFITPAVAFASMAANTALAVFLSLRHGPPIAVIGMAGGFLTPALVGAGDPNPAVLFSYLIALTMGLFTVIRREKWWWLLWPTMIAAFIWVVIWLAGPRVPGEGLWLGIFLIALITAGVMFASPSAKPGESPPLAGLGLTGAAAMATLLMGIVVQRNDFGMTEWGLYFALTAGTIVLAWRDQATYRWLPWIALALTLALLSLSPKAETFAGVTVLFAATYAIASIAFMWKARDPAEWARLACVSAGAFYLIAFFRLNDLVVAAKTFAPNTFLGQAPLWGMIATAVATAMALVTGRAVKRFAAAPFAQELLAYLAITVITFMALGILIEIRPDNVPVAVAGLMLAVAWVEARVDIKVLRPAITVVAMLFFLMLLPQLAPVLQYMTTASLGQVLTLKTPALVYAPAFHLGVPAALFVWSALELRRRSDDAVVHGFEAIAVTLVGVMGYFLIRHLQTTPDEILTTLGTSFDGAVISDLLIVYAIALVAAGVYLKRATLGLCGLIAAAIGLARVIHFDIQPLQLLDVWIPMAFGEVASKLVELPIATAPLFYLGVPAILALAMRLLLGRTRDDWLVRTVEYIPIALIGLMGYFLIRHAYHPAEQVLTAVGSRFEGGIISQSQIVYAIALMFAAQFFKRASLVNAAVIAAGIASLRIIAFDVQPLTFLAGSIRLFGGETIEGTIPMATAPIFHLGLPAVLLAHFSLTLKGARDRVATIVEYLVIAFVAFMGYFLIRQAFNGAENAFSAAGTYLERGVLTNAILIFGVALFAAGRYLNRQTLFVSGIIAAVYAIFRLAVFDYLTSSPLVAEHNVGEWPVVNALLLPYGLPIVWLTLLAQALQSRNRPELVPYAKGAALVSLFAWVSLNVRQYFHGAYLAAESVTSNEVYAYSAAWLLLGIGLLIAGTAWKDKITRFASLGVMVLTIVKVFLYDARELDGLLRVASFFGLGVSLFGLSWFYMRYVFASDAPKEAT
jgi:uncharacterized membrane protein